jgi:hypothetical protein
MKLGATRLGLCLLFALGSLSCNPPPAERHARGAFGVFFGGQVQERSEIQVSTTRLPTVGFRIEFLESRPGGHELRYEIIRPGPSSRRQSELGHAHVAPDRHFFDHRIELGPEVTYGTWNVRVTCDGFAVVDRPLVIQPES